MATTGKPTARKRAPVRPRTAARRDDEELILDLRDLVANTQRVLLSTGSFELRRMSSLSPLERARVEELQEVMLRLQDYDGDDDEQLRALVDAATDAQDEMLALALPGTARAARDAIPAPEQAGVLSAFFGMADEEAKATVRGLARMTTPPQELATTGARRSRASSASTAARRRSS